MLARAIARAGGRGWRWGLLVASIDAAGPDLALEAVSRRVAGDPILETATGIPDHPSPYGFEDLSFLFTDSVLSYGLIQMTLAEAALLFRETGMTRPNAIVEIGRYKGGGTILLAAAAPQATVWTIDNHNKERRLKLGGGRSYDDQLAAFLSEAGFANVRLLVGDSRTIAVDTGPLDVVFVDGDHSYEGCQSDIERFGLRLRPGGMLFLHDIDDANAQTATRAMQEAVDSGAFRSVRVVGTLAQLECL